MEAHTSPGCPRATKNVASCICILPGVSMLRGTSGGGKERELPRAGLAADLAGAAHTGGALGAVHVPGHEAGDRVHALLNGAPLGCVLVVSPPGPPKYRLPATSQPVKRTCPYYVMRE